MSAFLNSTARARGKLELLKGASKAAVREISHWAQAETSRTGDRAFEISNES
jgi:hypothetical protein